MTIQELVKELIKYPKDTQIMFSSDEEGNTYHSTANIALCDMNSEEDGKEDIKVVIFPLNGEDDIELGKTEVYDGWETDGKACDNCGRVIADIEYANGSGKCVQCRK